MIQRVVRCHDMFTEDKDVIEHFYDVADDDDLSAFGDDEFVYKMVKRGQEPVEDNDELGQIVKEMRLWKRNTPNPEPLRDYIVSAVSQSGMVIAVLLKVDAVDNTGEFDAFFLARIKTAI